MFTNWLRRFVRREAAAVLADIRAAEIAEVRARFRADMKLADRISAIETSDPPARGGQNRKSRREKRPSAEEAA